MIEFFIFLIQYSFSSWIPYSSQSFQNVLQKSNQIPLIVLCYSSYCEHCRGMPDNFKHFSEVSRHKDKINVIAIDCSHEFLSCSTFRVTGTPSVLFVTSPNTWEDLYCSTKDCMDYYLDYKLKPSISETTKEINEIIPTEKERKEGSTFYYVTNSKEDKIIDFLQNLSISYKFFDCTFYYKIDTNLNDVDKHLTVIQKKNCPITYYINETDNNMEELFKFVDLHKYSIFHHYNYIEVMNMPPEQLFTYYFTQNNLSEAELFNFDEFASNECSNVIYGIALKNDQKEFMKQSQLTFVDLPAFVTVDRLIRCTHVWKKGFKQYKTKYLKNVLSRKCQKEEIKPNTIQIPFFSLISLSLICIIFFLKQFRPKKPKYSRVVL